MTSLELWWRFVGESEDPPRLCLACGGEGRIVEEGPDYEGRDGNCYRRVIRDEICEACGGAGEVKEEAQTLIDEDDLAERDAAQWERS